MQVRRLVLVLAALVFAVAAPLGAGAAATSSGVASTGSIAGTVTGLNGVPVSGACVWLEGGAPAPAYVVSDAAGAYEFDDLPASPIDGFRIEVSASCSTDAHHDDYEIFYSNIVYVSADKTTTVNATLTLGGSMSGVVFDSNGQPLAGACVGAYSTGFAFGWAQGYTQTAEDGSFVLRGIQPGDYVVKVDGCYGSAQGPDIQPEYYDGTDSSGSTQDHSAATVLTINAGQHVDLNSLWTKPAADIVLSIQTDARSTDLYPQVIPQGLSTDLNDLGNVDVPDSNGDVRITNLIPGTYEIGYTYCGPSCRPGFISYYNHTGLDGTPTRVTLAEGQVLHLNDVVDVPPLVDTTTTLSATPTRVTVGANMTLTARVAAASGTHVPTGQVYFYENVGNGVNILLGVPQQLDSSAEATLSWTTEAGEHTVLAVYNGDGGSNTSQAQIAITDGVAPGGGGSGGGGGSEGGGGVPPASPVSGTVAAGGSLSSDPAGTSPDASNPLVVGVTSPVAGSVSIDKTAPDTQVSHYRILNVGATITAPAASAANPLKLSFQVFDGSLPGGAYPSDLTVFRDGAPVAACAKPGVVSPDPCVTSSTTSNGVTTINVLSSHASTWDVEAAQVGRVAGADRIATAAAVALDSFPNGGAGAVVLARADDFPDALVGAPLAAAKNAPLLLTEGTSLPKATADALSKVLAKGSTVYVLGGSKAVPETVATQLSTLGYQVTRYAGADRYTTAVAVADALGDPSTVMLATGANFPDALAAGPAAAHVAGAVLLTDGAILPQATSDYLAAHAGTTYAVGGPAAKADPNATAIVGADRYATAAALATRFFAAPSLVGVATGTSFPDALSGGAQLAHADGPLLLSTPSSVPGPTSDYLAGVKSGLTAVHLFGGPNALTDNVSAQLKNAV